MASTAESPGSSSRIPAWLWVPFLILVLLAAAIPIALWALTNTAPGRAFVARQVSGISLASGIGFDVGRIDGQLLSSFTLVDVVVTDLDGPLAVLPRVDVDWEPIQLLSTGVSVNRLDIPTVRLLRMWRINPRDPDEPLLPDTDIRIGRFTVGELILEEPVIGRREILSATGRTDIRDGRLLLDLQAEAARGDRLMLMVDAEPDRDRFDLEADLRAPVGGLVTTAAGLDRPVSLQASGAGSWARWRGTVAASLGEAQIADLVVQADDGRFRLTGEITPEPLLPEAARPLVAPAIALDATIGREGNRFGMELTARSDALALTGSGGIDVENNRLIGVRLDAELLRPQLANPSLSGSGIRLSVAGDGPLDTAPISWTVRADQLRFAGEAGPVGADGLLAEGTLLRGPPLAVPFRFSAARLVGLPPEQAALAQAPRARGTLLLAGDELRVTDLAVETTRLTATGSAVRRANGRIEAALDARIARFDVEGLGPIAVRAVARLALPPGGTLAADGRFEVRSLGLTNEGAADFLGGPPTLAGQFRLAPGGQIAVTDASFRSPALSFTGATARYDPVTGRFALDAAGRHRDYGPVAITASGTTAAPTASIRLASPGFGVGLADLLIEVEPAGGTAGGIDWRVGGTTPGGDLAGRGRLFFGSGQPLTLDIASISLGGVEASGRLVQTAAGPFAGTLLVAGRGIDGTIALSAQGAVQRIDLDATARGARLPLDPPVQIASGRVDLAILLLPDRPTVRGSFSATGVRRGTLALTNVNGDVNLAGTTGAARITAAGRVAGNQPFAVTAGVQSVAQGYAVRLDGTVGRQKLRLEQPALIARTADGWELQPVRLILPSGNVIVAGSLGETRTLRLVLDDVHLSTLNLFAPGLGLQGRASGQVNVRWDEGYPVPLGAANLRITGFSRAGVGGLSVPVDLAVSARSSTADGLVIGARMQLQGNDLGRLLVRVTPGEGETAFAQWQAGRLSGGIRYNGPVEPLWAFAALEGQELKGPVAIGADIAGTVTAPVLNGIVRGRGLLYRNVAFGTEISQINLEGRFAGPELVLTSLDGRTPGNGTLAGSGRVSLAGDGAADLRLEMKRARVADSDIAQMTLSGPLAVKGSFAALAVTGDLRIDDARIVIVQVETSEIPQLRVRRAGEVNVPPPDPGFSTSNVALDIRIRADDRVRVEGMGLDSIWRADVRVRGTASQPLLTGSATMARGDFSFAGNDFTLTTGRVVFNGAPMQSSIDIRAETRAEDVTAIIRIGGTAIQPEISFSSQPPLPEDEILARLLFGSSVADLSVTEALQLASAVAGLQSGTDTMGKIRRSVGLDRLRLVGEDGVSGLGAGIAIGKRLTRNVYVEVITDSQGNTLATVQWSLSRTLSLLAEVSSLGRNSLNLRYQREY